MGMMKQYSQFTVRTQFTQKAFSFLYNKKLYFCEIIIKKLYVSERLEYSFRPGIIFFARATRIRILLRLPDGIYMRNIFNYTAIVPLLFYFYLFFVSKNAMFS